MRKQAAKLLVSVSLLGALAGCGDLPATGRDGQGNPGRADSTSPVEVKEAREKLERLPVKGRAPRTGFDRDEFGPAWADVDHNGCDTRNDILKRDLEEETFKKGTHDCVVLTGVLEDPYSGKTIHFRRGNETSMEVQIDHVVPLADAWQKGAQRWSEDKRKQFANDPLNLLAVDGPLNNQKSDSDAASWLPPRRAYRCEYVARQIEVKAKYELWVTAAEKAAMERVLAAC
ncbi:HNH endonuclease family protein [Thermoactinospora rubra]|uniref:HNH endonuclease family protein n=1 Tax=Thermoactinospora rubra TaxID=1088767 RepID=UPI001F0B2B0F|nr:HNH endonuclease family protein [Thermoactinospora rubra]